MTDAETAVERSATAAGGADHPAILALAPHQWEGPRMNRQHLLTRLARRGWPVVFSRGLLTIWERNSTEWSTLGLLPRVVGEDGVDVHKTGRLIPSWPGRSLWDRAAHAIYTQDLARRLAPYDRWICIVFHPRLAALAERLRPDGLVYYAYDAYSLSPGWTSEDRELERRCVERADIVVASSELIAANLPEPGPRRARILHNGGDAAAFARGPSEPCPEDLAAIPRPRIGYVGNLTPKVDVAVVAGVAQRRPDLSWVLVGPLWMNNLDRFPRARELADALSLCQRLPNVHFLGVKPVTRLPAYVAHMDVNTMCYRTDEGGWWRAGYPLKLHEYLAAGLPVVAADLPALRPFEAVLHIASGIDDWIGAIDLALRHGGVGTLEQRRAVAFANSWDVRVELLDGWLRDLARGAPSPGIQFGS